MTYGELYQLVDLARASGVDPATSVAKVRADDHGEDLGVEALEADLDSTRDLTGAVTLLGDEVRGLASVLDGVLENEGDARDMISELGKWRDRLLGL